MRIRRGPFERLPGGYGRLAWAWLIVLSCCGLLAAALPWLMQIAREMSAASPMAVLAPIARSAPTALRDAVSTLTGQFMPILPSVLVVTVTAVLCGTWIGIAIPARGVGRVLGLGLVILPFGLSFGDAHWLAGWMVRPVLPRPPSGPLTMAVLVWQSLPVVALVVHGALAGLDDRVWQSARRDGLGAVDRLRLLWLPRLWPAWWASGLVVCGLATLRLMSVTAHAPGSTAARLLLWGGFAVLVGLASRAVGAALFPMSADVGGSAARVPDGTGGRPVRGLSLALASLPVMLPVVALIAIATGGLDAVVPGRAPIDVLDLLWPEAPTVAHLQGALLDAGLRRTMGLAVAYALVCAVIAVSFGWPAAWALSRCGEPGRVAHPARSLLLAGALLPSGFIAGGLLPSPGGWAAGGGSWWTPVLLAGAGVAAATAWLESVTRLRWSGSVGVLDERAILSGARPARIATVWRDPQRSPALILSGFMVFALLCHGALAPAMAVLAGDGGGSAAGPRAARLLLLAAPVWLAAMVAVQGLARPPSARSRPLSTGVGGRPF